MENRDFICSECTQKLQSKNLDEEKAKKYRAAKGCYGVLDRAIHSIEGRIKFSTCIGNLFSYSALSYIGMHDLYEKGTMPFSGSVGDQPNKVIEAFGVVKSFKIEKMKQDQQRQKLKQRARGR